MASRYMRQFQKKQHIEKLAQAKARPIRLCNVDGCKNVRGGKGVLNTCEIHKHDDPEYLAARAEVKRILEQAKLAMDAKHVATEGRMTADEIRSGRYYSGVSDVDPSGVEFDVIGDQCALNEILDVQP